MRGRLAGTLARPKRRTGDFHPTPQYPARERLPVFPSRLPPQITEKFVLRRTKDVIQGSLPAASEIMVFCRPSGEQLALYESCVASSRGARALLGRGEGASTVRGVLKGVLPLISTLRKLCNHPALVRDGGAGIEANAASGAGVDTVVGGRGLGEGGADDDGSEGGEENEEEEEGSDDDDVDSDAEDVAFLMGDDDGQVSTSPRGAVPEPPPACEETHLDGGGRGGEGGRKPAPWKVPVTAAVERVKTLPASLGVKPDFETRSSGKLLVLEALLGAVRGHFPSDKVGGHSFRKEMGGRRNGSGRALIAPQAGAVPKGRNIGMPHLLSIRPEAR